MKAISPRWIERLKDGTVKQVNPFTGARVWTVPQRAGRPHQNISETQPKLIEPRVPEDYCNFCEGHQAETTPERARLVFENGKFKVRSYLSPKESLHTASEFRRISNLFEIVSYDYWRENYDLKLSRERENWKEAYTADSKGERHIKDILEYKFRLQGKSEEWIGQTLWHRWREMADGLFGGSHDLVIAKRHFIPGACFETDLAASGELSPEEHSRFIQFTLSSIQDIYANNPHVVYASVFQNWLAPAGASFDHLHKQIVGLDERGSILEKMIKIVTKNPQFFNENYLNYCIQENLLLAENKSALCLVGFGERFPTLVILSKGKAKHPWELSSKEVQDLSDLTQACHRALGAETPCNEEWFFTPLDSPQAIPWMIFLKWRINTPAGFEGNTEIYINTIEPTALRDQMVETLLGLRE